MSNCRRRGSLSANVCYKVDFYGTEGFGLEWGPEGGWCRVGNSRRESLRGSSMNSSSQWGSGAPIGEERS